MYEDMNENNKQDIFDTEPQPETTYTSPNPPEPSNDYNYNYNYSAQPQQEKAPAGNGFGIASLVLGIISLVLFCCCVNVPFAVLAIIFGIIQLVRGQGSGKGLAIGGLITAGCSIVAMIVFYIIIATMTPSNITDMEKFIEEYSNYDNTYNFDYDDDYDSDDHHNDDDTF